MSTQNRYPPKGSWTRRFFLYAIVVMTVVFALAHLVGPLLMAGEGDPRPFVALLPPIYATVLILGVLWIAWFVWVRKPR